MKQCVEGPDFLNLIKKQFIALYFPIVGQSKISVKFKIIVYKFIRVLLLLYNFVNMYGVLFYHNSSLQGDGTDFILHFAYVHVSYTGKGVGMRPN